MTASPHTALTLRSLELYINLGWQANERSELQMVSIDLIIRFAKPPRACETDDLTDTLCYAKLTQKIREKTAKKSFHLLEHVSAILHHLIKEELPHGAHLTLHVTKHPNIEGLNGGVTFSYSDDVA